MELDVAPSNSSVLDYGATPSSRRKWIRRAFALTAFLLLALALWRWGPPAWQQAQLLYWQRQCLRYSPSGDEVVYEEEPTAAASLLRSGGSGYVTYTLNRRVPRQFNQVITAARVPECWNRFDAARRNGPVPTMRAGFGAVLFLHERTSPCGNQRLVLVCYFPQSDAFTAQFIEGYNWEPYVVTPATLTGQPAIGLRGYELSVLSGTPRHAPAVRVYAGQADAADPSHFTISYEMWGKSDILDGRLDDHDRVTLTPRHPPTPE